MSKPSYYEDQLSKLKNSEYGFSLQIRDSQGNKTNWLKLNRQSAGDLIGFFFKQEIAEVEP